MSKRTLSKNFHMFRLWRDAVCISEQMPPRCKNRERSASFFSALISEIETLAAAMGIKYEKSLVKINLDILDALSPDASTSMQRDIAAGKQSEIDGLIYEVVRLADKYGLSLPAYRKISEKFRLDGLK